MLPQSHVHNLGTQSHTDIYHITALKHERCFTLIRSHEVDDLQGITNFVAPPQLECIQVPSRSTRCKPSKSFENLSCSIKIFFLVPNEQSPFLLEKRPRPDFIDKATRQRHEYPMLTRTQSHRER